MFVIPQELYAVRFHAGSTHSRMPVQRFLRVAAAKDRVVFERFPDSGPPRSEDARAVDVLYEREASRLWSGERPALLGQLAARGSFGRLGRRVRLLVWAAWGRVSPGSLRLGLRLWISACDRVASRRLPDGELVEWRYG